MEGYAQPPPGPCINDPQNRQCWGTFDINTDYHEITPNTGNTVQVINVFIVTSYASIT